MPFIHVERPNGSHSWTPFDDVDQARRVVERLAPHMPHDATWDVTETSWPVPTGD